MTLKEKTKAQQILKVLAAKDGVPVWYVRRSIQETIDDAWARAQQDPDLKATWTTYFPSGQKPTPEEFIVHLGRRISAGEDPPYLLG